MLAINVSIPNLTVARLEQFPSPQMTDNKPSFRVKGGNSGTLSNFVDS